MIKVWILNLTLKKLVTGKIIFLYIYFFSYEMFEYFLGTINFLMELKFHDLLNKINVYVVIVLHYKNLMRKF